MVSWLPSLHGNACAVTQTTSATTLRSDAAQPTLSVSPISRAGDGGCNFLVRPTFNATETTVFWAPDTDPGTVVLAALPAAPGLESVESRELDSGTARAAADGLSVIHGHGASAVRLILIGDVPPDHPVAALVPLGADGLDRIDAVTRLWRAFNKRTVPPDARLTAQQRRRLRRILQAVDGRMDGASYREIADAIYGASRVAEDLWKTSALRDSTIDLVKDGFALIGGGYRKLLRHRRRS